MPVEIIQQCSALLRAAIIHAGVEPAGRRYVLWAVSPDQHFIKLGQIVNAPGRNEAEIRSEVNLPDLGLFITTEDADRNEMPSGPIVATILPDAGM